ncbi:MAG: beta-galactosidase trimerization domain-containing protein [Victivallales bacterium]|nr:beta-galactosidase trimerization domain-containing protein [Victivallales bacterium]
MHNLRFRQIHLDFHTSPHIPEIGVAFDKQKWQETLKASHINSITCFAVCHHGWSYYNTEVGERHPHLDFDLLRAQFDACKEIDINVPIYLTAGINNWGAAKHPEWRELRANGQYGGGGPEEIINPGFHSMCFNSPFLDFLCDQIREVARLFPNCDGLFYDIISQGQCCCKWCMKSMEEKGLDAASEHDRKIHSAAVLKNYYKKTTAASKELDPDMPVFHNSGHITRGDRDILKYFSHLELESLPTGGWGYDHFPMGAKYCTNLEHDFLGMTGKFHTTWGEFGGFKHPNALRYECAAMIAYNAKCSIGDQLHPCGKLDESTYKLIGSAYKEVESKEAWCVNAESVADVAVLSSVAVNPEHPREEDSDVGVTRILLESHLLFDIIDMEMDFSKYALLILPDDVLIDEKLKKLLDAYLTQGGKLFLTGKSGLNADETEFLFDLGATLEGTSEFSPDYILPFPDVRADFVDSPLVCYTRSYRTKITDGESLGDVYDPYFNRSYKHFCSHQHAPNKLDPSGFACGVMKNQIMYLAHPVFTMYRSFGAVAVKEYIVNCIKKLLGDDLSLTTNLPSTARITLNEQVSEKRSILHLLSANTILRGGQVKLSGGTVAEDGLNIEVIEDLLPLHNTALTLKTSKPVKSISLEPQGKELAFEQLDNAIKINVDEFTCHQMVVLHH